MPDLKSVLVAGAVGAALELFLFSAAGEPGADYSRPAFQGFALGAAVQIAVRLLGVS